jgi:hypothetical protein
MSDIAAPVLPDHVKKPNEEEYKKSLEQVNSSIEKIQKQFVRWKKLVIQKKKKKHLIQFIFRMPLEKRLPNYLVKMIILVVRKSRLN